MKKTFWIITCCFIAQLAMGQATPKWAEKAKKAVFSIVTYDKENKIKGTGNGFYIDAQGTALSDFTLFEGAERAVIINADGKQAEVSRIGGANSIYDIVKFTTPVDKKQISLPLATQPAKVGETVYLLPYSTQKATTCQTGKVTAVDSIGNNSFYYTLEMKTGEKTVSCPIMNANGQVLGLIQKNASDESTESYAIGASYGAALSVGALSMNDAALSSIAIPMALPDDEEQALVFLLMSSQKMPEARYMLLLEDFMNKFPASYDGYLRRALYFMENKKADNYAQADADLNKAIDTAKQKSEVKHHVAKAIYAFLISLQEGETAYESWTYDRALNLIREALKEDAQPLYMQMEGDILYAQKNYAEAYNCFQKLNSTPMASAATYYSAAKAKQMTEGSDINEVIALMDSVIVRLNKPYIMESAAYFYERANMKADAKKYREAVLDYNQFEEIVGSSATAAFYFEREQVEMQCRMYQQALNDIIKADELQPNNVDILLEKGAVHLRVNQLDEALAAFQKVVSLDNQSGAGYRLLGYTQALKKKNKEACVNFEKAKALGDTLVDKLIEKYCK